MSAAPRLVLVRDRLARPPRGSARPCPPLRTQTRRGSISSDNQSRDIVPSSGEVQRRLSAWTWRHASSSSSKISGVLMSLGVTPRSKYTNVCGRRRSPMLRLVLQEAMSWAPEKLNRSTRCLSCFTQASRSLPSVFISESCSRKSVVLWSHTQPLANSLQLCSRHSSVCYHFYLWLNASLILSVRSL